MVNEHPHVTGQLFNNKERRLLIFTGISHAISDAWYLIYPALLFLIAVDYGDFLFLGIVANVMIATRGVSGVISGFLADHYSNKALYGTFAIVSSLGCLLVYFSTNEIMLVLAFAILGFGTGIYHPVGLSGITRFISEKTRALGIHEAAGCFGLSLFPVLLMTIGITFGWRYAFLCAALVSLLPVLLLPIVQEEYDKPSKHIVNKHNGLTQTKLVLKTFTNKSILLIYLLIVLLEGSAMGLDTFIPIAIADIGGLGETKVIGLSITGLFVSFMILGGVPGSLYGGLIGTKLGIYRALNVALIISIPLLILLAFVSGNWFLALMPILRGSTNMRAPILNSLISRNLPNDMQGKGFALMYGIAPIVGSFIALAAGAIAKFYGLNWVFPMAAILLIIALPLINLGKSWSNAPKQ